MVRSKRRESLQVSSARFILVVLLLLVVFAAPQPAFSQQTQKESLVKIGPIWLKVSVKVPSELVATNEYEVPVTVTITEVEGDLKVFYLKALRFTVDTSVYEYVPDTPIPLSLGRQAYLSVKLTPRFFASQMAPGDVKDTSLRIDLSYYYEAVPKGGSPIQESGYYSAFTSIPVRVIAPKTYVYVEPYLKIDYEPYVVRFFVDIWVQGEGYIENAQAQVEGAPVQCYLLTTGRMNVNERRTLEFLMNVSKLGPFVKSQYSVQVKVAATTPWGYTYTYVYPLSLSIKPVREAKVSAPSTVVAGAYVPISIALTPPVEKDEQATVTVYWGGQPVYSGSFSPTIYAAFPEGEAQVAVKVDSNKYSPVTSRFTVKSVRVEPKVSLQVTAGTLVVRVSPLYQNSNVDVKVVGSGGAVVFATSLPDASFSKTPTSIDGASAVEGTATLPLSLDPGSYQVVATYNSPWGSKTQTVTYTVPGATAGAQEAPGALFQPIILVAIVAVVAIVIVVVVIRRRRE
ncbi:hypothetical protein [Thermofilum pendens]|uniref:Uncharacterized protein n=1 Tax=Thermofilum pendens (strain DSM 2475 / Hrk 5) TaxID=368408 RepID=A1RYP3_THEPD|nr:hypothetical protein [Thermofilum pendens]ABL78323.1 hypothetical protein Tpen_0922 [Thermofilum pendens Hrk 5]